VGLILHPLLNLEKHFAQKPFIHGLLALSPPCFVLSCRGPWLALEAAWNHVRNQRQILPGGLFLLPGTYEHSPLTANGFFLLLGLFNG
jgi:hypothetical protein